MAVELKQPSANLTYNCKRAPMLQTARGAFQHQRAASCASSPEALPSPRTPNKRLRRPPRKGLLGGGRG
eukprot:8727620-Alexandrium_andersonii.AAC.1